MARLIADIGGTNARFAIVEPTGAVRDVRVLSGADFDGLADAYAAYVDGLGADERPTRAAIAVASPVAGDRVEMTNLAWSFSTDETRRALGLERLEVLNDFTAIALAVPWLGADDLVRVGGGEPAEGAAKAILGAGTGLGVSGLVPANGDWTPLVTEGGHATLPAATDREAAVIAFLRREFGHVSAERALSGPGLVNLYRAIGAIEGRDVDAGIEPADVTERGLAGSCGTSAEALAMFADMLGTVAGNVALTLGALGGVYVAGGIVPRFAERFAESGFRRRFEDKGRFRAYLAPVPVYVVTEALPAFVGLAHVVNRG